MNQFKKYTLAVIIGYGYGLCIAPVFGQKKYKTDTLTYSLTENIQYRTEAGLTDYDKSNCVMDVYYPKYKKNFGTVIWFHGGSLTGGKKEIPQILKNQGYAVVGVEYRKYPNVKSPVYIQDAAAAVAWVMKNIAGYGGDPANIVLSGHSAGGYLALMVGMDKKWLSEYQCDYSKIKALIPLSPQVITHFTIRKERGIDDKSVVVDEFAPIYHIKNNLPPVFVITGDRELEMLGRYEENAYFIRMLKLNGHTDTELYELEGFSHGSMLQPGLFLLTDKLKTMFQL